jgi:hypothetical protein
MAINDLRALIKWADVAIDNADFWRRIWYAARVYDPRTRALLRGLVAGIGVVPED